MTQDERSETIAALWNAGWKRPAIATRVNMTFAGVTQNLIRQGLYVSKKQLSPEKKASAIADATTTNVLQIAMKYNIARTTLYTWKVGGFRASRKKHQSKLNRS